MSITRAKELLFLVHPEIARDRYRVDIIVDPSRFILELPDELMEAVAVAAEVVDDAFDALPDGGRYQLPGFLDSGDDDVN